MRYPSEDVSVRTLFMGALAVLLASILAGCAGVQRAAGGGEMRTYVLSPRQADAPSVAGGGPLLVVLPPQAQPGYDTTGMVYTRRAHELEYFAHSQWADLPTAMLGPVLVNALSASGRFRGVVAGPSDVSGDLRLETRIVSLRQEFDVEPSRVRVSLRTQLIEPKTREVLATRTFEVVREASSNDPYGGVVAINKALEQLLDQLVSFCANPGVAGTSNP